MLQQIVPHSLLISPTAQSDPVTERAMGVAEIWAGIRQHKFLIALCCAVSIAMGGTFVYLAKPVYVAKTQVYIHPAQRAPSRAETVVGLLQLDNAQLESQVQLLESERIARHVIRAMNLVDNPELRPERVSSAQPQQFSDRFLPALIDTNGSGDLAPPDHFDTTRALNEAIVIRNFRQRLSAVRVGQSYVLEISFWAYDPELATRVANAVTAAYIRDQINERLEAANRGGEILEGRINALRTDVQALDRAVRAGLIDIRSFPSADGRVISSAWLPLEKSWPRTSLILALSGLMGMLVGGAAATIRAASDDRVRSAKQIESTLNTFVMGTLPQVRMQSTAHALDHIVTNPSSPFSRDVRQIKAEIEIAMQDGNVRCIGFASALPREGKSVIASNIAHAFAAVGRSTLLVDFDVYEQTLSSSFGVASPIELSTLVSDFNYEGRTAALPLSNNLDFLPSTCLASDVESSEFLGSPYMRAFLDRLRAQYDVIFVDLPAISTAPDARAISPFLDGIVVVTKFNSTTSTALSEAVQRLNRPAAKVIGIILNMYKR